MNFGQVHDCGECPCNIYQRHREFMDAFHENVPTSPQLSKYNKNLVLLYKKLVEEESQELKDAIESYYKKRSKKKNDINALNSIASEAVDLLYVTLGLLDSIGVKGEDIFTEIHRANMDKVGKDGKVSRNKNGKVLKPKDWKRADTTQVIKKQMG